MTHLIQIIKALEFTTSSTDSTGDLEFSRYLGSLLGHVSGGFPSFPKEIGAVRFTVEYERLVGADLFGVETNLYVGFTGVHW